MSKKDSWFMGEGKGIENKVPPIAVRYPRAIDEILRRMPDRSTFIRDAVIEKLQREGLLGGG